MRGRMLVVLGVVFIVAGGASPAPAAGSPRAFRALWGKDAAGFTVPSDMRLVQRLQIGGLTYERYQQFFGGSEAQVLGGQVTVYKNVSGATVVVVGARYPAIVATSSVAVSQVTARGVAEREIGARGERIVDLMIDPANGRYFYRVETRRFASRWIHLVDAATGRLITSFNALAHDHGTGVKGDTKDMNGPDNIGTDDDLTTFHATRGHGARGAHWDLTSKDNRQTTFNGRNRIVLSLSFATDADNHWTLVTTNRRSPGQPALIDAQYYANVTDDYFLGRHGFNWTSGCGYTAMNSVAHFSRNYSNAFWNGVQTVYGDGDGIEFRELSGGLDVVAHEHTHGITDCTSGLIYANESGALNESFSDVLGSSAEFFAAAGGLDAAATPDWLIGEDVYLLADTVPGFRNMGDPEEDGDPDHYSERQIGGDDNGGVHTNSAIPNHAFYLLVNGGRNASCVAPATHNSAHCTGSDPTVAGIGVADAERIFFQAFIGLPTNATMCQARQATVAQAAALFGSGSQQQVSTTAAWDAVGVPTSC